VFPDFYRGILRSSELTGQLDTVLDQLAAYLERDLAARRKITSAMIYPSVIIVMSIIAVIVLSTFVLPRFKVFFDGLHAELPLPTRMLLGFTAFIGTWWWLILAVLAVVGVAIAFGLRTARGQYLRDATYLKIPVIKGTVRDALVERFCRILASMTSAGVALPEALRVATGALHNGVYERALSRVEEQMLEGEGIAKPIGETLLFPSLAVQMMRVGEQTGSLDDQLEVAARYYERELDYKIKRLTELFEPAVILVMGVVVGFVAIALVSAMYGIFNQVEM
jgi:type IV pilus assembly protein PilC